MKEEKAMGLIVIDEEQCKKDGLCASECPAVIIRLNKETGFPEMVTGGEERCLLCGHCVAVCPHGALTHKHCTREECPPIDPKLVITEKQAEQFLRTRRSIRFYQDKPVEREKIQRLIEIARYAPTGSNSQLVHWLVIDDEKRIKELAGLSVEYYRCLLQEEPQAASYASLPRAIAAWDAGFDAILRSAPALIVASAPQEAYNGMIDVTLALCYLELMAPVLGLGTCWAGMLQRALRAAPGIKEALGIPAGHLHHYPMMLGYPKVKYHRLPQRKPPRITFA
jgi:nitroreductase/NAD-dependent dihydropyrimidine dehydrogenase PreA subunit